MKPEELARTQHLLRFFLRDLLALMGRQERQFWGEVYVRGLLLEGERKSVEPMAARLPEGNVQAMQQMVGQSPWAHEPLRRRLAQRMTRLLARPRVWIVDDTGFPKQGECSVGVARQYSGTLGKVGNCQVAVALHYATDDACVPLDMELYLPKSWTDDRARCDKAGVPLEMGYREKWRIALDLIAQARAWAIPPGVVVADADYGRVGAFRRQLQAWQLGFVLGVHRDQGVEPLAPLRRPTRGRPPRSKPSSALPVEAVARALPEAAWQAVPWREGSRGWLSSRFAALRVADVADGQAPTPGWLLIEWPDGEPDPTRYWLSNLPADIPLTELVYLAKSRWAVEQNYQQLKEELGLDHYEGRSYRGWHHHVTLTFLAYAFLVYLRLRTKKNYWVDDPGSPT